jgi:hypothetical protein
MTMAAAIETRNLTKVLTEEMTAGVQGITLREAEARQEASLCTGEGERLGLYDVIEEEGPITALELALEATIPMSLAARWLASQTQSGYVVRDVETGRYRTWCVLPKPDRKKMHDA